MPICLDSRLLARYSLLLMLTIADYYLALLGTSCGANLGGAGMWQGSPCPWRSVCGTGSPTGRARGWADSRLPRGCGTARPTVCGPFAPAGRHAIQTGELGAVLQLSAVIRDRNAPILRCNQTGGDSNTTLVR